MDSAVPPNSHLNEALEHLEVSEGIIGRGLFGNCLARAVIPRKSGNVLQGKGRMSPLTHPEWVRVPQGGRGALAGAGTFQQKTQLEFCSKYQR